VRGLVALLTGGAHFRLAALPVFVFDVRQLVLVLAHEDLLSNHLVVARAVVAGRLVVILALLVGLRNKRLEVEKIGDSLRALPIRYINVEVRRLSILDRRLVSVAGRPRTIARLFLDSFRITPVWLLYRQIDFT